MRINCLSFVLVLLSIAQAYATYVDRSLQITEAVNRAEQTSGAAVDGVNSISVTKEEDPVVEFADSPTNEFVGAQSGGSVDSRTPEEVAPPSEETPPFSETDKLSRTSEQVIQPTEVVPSADMKDDTNFPYGEYTEEQLLQMLGPMVIPDAPMIKERGTEKRKKKFNGRDYNLDEDIWYEETDGYDMDKGMRQKYDYDNAEKDFRREQQYDNGYKEDEIQWDNDTDQPHKPQRKEPDRNNYSDDRRNNGKFYGGNDYQQQYKPQYNKQNKNRYVGDNSWNHNEDRLNKPGYYKRDKKDYDDDDGSYRDKKTHHSKPQPIEKKTQSSNKTTIEDFQKAEYRWEKLVEAFTPFIQGSLNYQNKMYKKNGRSFCPSYADKYITLETWNKKINVFISNVPKLCMMHFEDGIEVKRVIGETGDVTIIGKGTLTVDPRPVELTGHVTDKWKSRVWMKVKFGETFVNVNMKTFWNVMSTKVCLKEMIVTSVSNNMNCRVEYLKVGHEVICEGSRKCRRYSEAICDQYLSKDLMKGHWNEDPMHRLPTCHDYSDGVFK